MKLLLFIAIVLLTGILPAEETGSFARSVAIGSDRTLFVECQGNGSPSVIFVSGRSDTATVWKPILAQVAKFTKACAYDRPGTVTIKQNQITPSRSTPVPQPTTPKNGVDDLHALLTAAKIPPPYVLVGHSFGGLIVRLFASTYPEEVSGLVLIDTLTEQLYDALTPEQQALWIQLNSNYEKELDRYTVQERTDFKASFDQMHKASPLHPMPVIVLTSDQPYDFRALIAQGVIPPDAPLEWHRSRALAAPFGCSVLHECW